MDGSDLSAFSAITRLLVAGHSGMTKRVAHRHRHDERNGNHRCEVVGEPGFVADRFEPERDGLGWAAENRHGHRIRQADAGSAHERREQFRFNNGVDGCVTRNDRPGGCDQEEGCKRALRCL